MSRSQDAHLGDRHQDAARGEPRGGASLSILPATEPACSRCPSTPAIATIIDARPRDIGGFKVRRLLPSFARRLVGPFIFFDHMGPAELAPGEGLDVRPHPHIGLSTVTYLFEGEIVHRDSLGSDQAIRPGEINWMTAGRGIVHSERTSPESSMARSAVTRSTPRRVACSSSCPGQMCGCAQKPIRASCSSAARLSTGSGRSGGTSCRARKSESSRRRATGRKGGSKGCPMTKWSASPCPNDAKRRLLTTRPEAARERGNVTAEVVVAWLLMRSRADCRSSLLCNRSLAFRR